MSVEREMTIEHAHVLIQARNVWRWSLANINRRQSVAEHSYCVAVLGLLIYDQCVHNHSSLTRTSLLIHLLTHDAEEALTGDIPAPVKVAIERRAPGLLSAIAHELGAKNGSTYAFGHDYLGAIVKIADRAETHWFAEDNHAPAHIVQYTHESYLQALVDAGKFPEADWAKAGCLITEIRIRERAHERVGSVAGAEKHEAVAR